MSIVKISFRSHLLTYYVNELNNFKTNCTFLYYNICENPVNVTKSFWWINIYHTINTRTILISKNIKQ